MDPESCVCNNVIFNMLVDLNFFVLIQLFNELQARDKSTSRIEHISKLTIRELLQFVYQARVGELVHTSGSNACINDPRERAILRDAGSELPVLGRLGRPHR